MQPQAKLGSISWGTIIPEDIVSVLLDELDRLDVSDDYTQIRCEAGSITDDDYESDDLVIRNWISEVMTRLMDALTDFAPAYCYFGLHEGDGSDLGYWPDWDYIEDDVRAGDLLQVSDLADVPEGNMLPVLVVNDHGNATLYAPRVQLVNVWECV